MDTTSTHNARYMAISRVRNSLIRSLLFHSQSLNLKSDSERFTLVAIQKRATVSKSLSQLFTKNRRQWFAHDLSKSLLKNRRFAKKIIFLYVFDSFSLLFLFLFQEQIAPVAQKKSDREQIPPVAHYKTAILNFLRANRSFAHKKERFAQKTKERIPTLAIGYHIHTWSGLLGYHIHACKTGT